MAAHLEDSNFHFHCCEEPIFRKVSSLVDEESHTFTDLTPLGFCLWRI